MNQIREHWDLVNRVAETIPSGVVHLVTVERLKIKQRAGVMTTALNIPQNRLAARLIAAETHRLATKEEIDAYEAKEARDRKRLKAEADARGDGRQVVLLTPDLLEQINGATNKPEAA